jgi:protein CpxP
MEHRVRQWGLVVFVTSTVAWAQPTLAAYDAGQEAAPSQPRRPPMERTLQGGWPGRWWRNPQLTQKLGLTPDQSKKMDDIFQQSRPTLIDLTASLDKEEALLEPLVEAEQPDPGRIRAQIERVAQARAELEKANANMLLGIRLLLTPDQWKGLQASASGPRAKRLESPIPKKR